MVNFAIPANHRMKIKESKLTNKHLDHARELKKLWNMKVMVILIIVGTHGKGNWRSEEEYIYIYNDCCGSN